ncbi:hypothetical protein P167DRAFT_545536 [Morchella conica CCBAS932]|uniref:Uncharacterized protein n=1 Tax=Morchella conica CCBAS932 TaxID=1392247 RepID=A0A3N4KNW3_9PEZI|nr:hypothetical protein P167DRAFT_545536 [Morchella conica CCBAS932]
MKISPLFAALTKPSPISEDSRVLSKRNNIFHAETSRTSYSSSQTAITNSLSNHTHHNPKPTQMEHYIRLLTTQLTTYTSQGGHLHITQREATRKIVADTDAYLCSIGLIQHAVYDMVVAQVAVVFRRHLRYARWCLVVWGRRFIMDSRCATCKERPKITFNVAAFANPFRRCGAGHVVGLDGP